MWHEELLEHMLMIGMKFFSMITGTPIEEDVDDKVYAPLPPAFDIFKRSVKQIRKDKKIKRLALRGKYL